MIQETWLAALTILPFHPAAHPQEPLSSDVLGDAKVVDAEGSWTATLEILPVPEGAANFHGRQRPWKLGRVFGTGAAIEVVANHLVADSGRGAPSFIGIGPDGTTNVTWRGGRAVLRVMADGSTTALRIELEYDWEAFHLDDDGIVHGIELEGGDLHLKWRPIDDHGFGKPVDLGRSTLQHAPRFHRSGNRLIWFRGPEMLAILDVTTDEIQELNIGPYGTHYIDGVMGDWLFLHDGGHGNLAHQADAEARLVNLLDGSTLGKPCSMKIESFGPFGIRTHFGLMDPVLKHRPDVKGLRIDGYPDPWSSAWPLSHWAARMQPKATTPETIQVIPKQDRDARRLLRELDKGELNMRRHMNYRPLFHEAAYVDAIARVAREADDANDRSVAIRILGNSHWELGMPHLLALMAEEEHWYKRLPMVVALGRMGNVEAVPHMIAAIPSDELHGYYADSVATSLALLGGREALDYVAVLSEHVPNECVHNCLQLLSQHEEFLAVLRKARKSD